MTKKAIVLLSGGMDSATVLALVQSRGWQTSALSFDYRQRHAVELDCARALAAHYRVAEHIVYPLDLRVFGGSALSGDWDVPKGRKVDTMASSIPVTYVPARNMIFLSIALALAETRGAGDIFIGANHIDYSGYPDCRPQFLAAWQKTANLGTKRGVENQDGYAFVLHSPLIDMSKSDIIRLGLELGVDYSMTSSCYDPGDHGACGVCDACVLRQRAFNRLNIPDPACPDQSDWGDDG